MRMSTDAKERVKRIIRDATALNPLISLRELQKVLLKKNIHIGNLNTLGKFRTEIADEAVSEADPRLIKQHLARVKEKNRIITEKLWPIALGTGSGEPGIPLPSYSEQIRAASMIIKLDLSLFKTEIELGVFKKGPMTREEELWMRNRPIPPEYRESIKRAMENWGFDKLPREKLKDLDDNTSNTNKH